MLERIKLGHVDIDKTDIRVLESVLEAVVKSLKRVPIAITRSASRAVNIRARCACYRLLHRGSADGYTAVNLFLQTFRRPAYRFVLQIGRARLSLRYR